jgi:hypothetical protein
VHWRILKDKIKNPVLQRTELVRDTGESSEDEKTGKSENLVETKVVSTSRKLMVMWTEKVMLTRHQMVLNVLLKTGNKVSSLSPSWKEHGCTLSIPKVFEVDYTYEW